MKKSVKILALVLVVTTLCVALVSCGKKLSGEYKALDIELLGQKASVTYTFKGNKYEKTTETTILGQVSTETEEGTYKIVKNDDNTMEITLTKKDAEKGNTFTFAEGDGYIKIGMVKLDKIEK